MFSTLMATIRRTLGRWLFNNRFPGSVKMATVIYPKQEQDGIVSVKEVSAAAASETDFWLDCSIRHYRHLSMWFIPEYIDKLNGGRSKLVDFVAVVDRLHLTSKLDAAFFHLVTDEQSLREVVDAIAELPKYLIEGGFCDEEKKRVVLLDDDRLLADQYCRYVLTVRLREKLPGRWTQRDIGDAFNNFLTKQE